METKRGRILIISLILFVYILIGMAVKVNSTNVNRRHSVRDDSIDSVLTLSSEKANWPYTTVDTMLIVKGSIPIDTFIVYDDESIYDIKHIWYWPSRTEVTSEFVSFAAGSGSSPWSSGEQVTASGQLDSIVSMAFRTGTTLDASEIGTDAITANKIADNTITANKIADNTITVNKIANDAITAAKIADNTVTADKIANDAITAAKIADDAIGISENAAVRYLAELLTVYPGSKARTFYGADKDSVSILDSTFTEIAHMIFYHYGGSEGDAPDTVRVTKP